MLPSHGCYYAKPFVLWRAAILAAVPTGEQNCFEVFFGVRQYRCSASLEVVALTASVFLRAWTPALRFVEI